MRALRGVAQGAGDGTQIRAAGEDAERDAGGVACREHDEQTSGYHPQATG